MQIQAEHTCQLLPSKVTLSISVCAHPWSAQTMGMLVSSSSTGMGGMKNYFSLYAPDVLDE